MRPIQAFASKMCTENVFRFARRVFPELLYKSQTLLPRVLVPVQIRRYTTLESQNPASVAEVVKMVRIVHVEA